MLAVSAEVPTSVCNQIATNGSLKLLKKITRAIITAMPYHAMQSTRTLLSIYFTPQRHPLPRLTRPSPSQLFATLNRRPGPAPAAKDDKRHFGWPAGRRAGPMRRPDSATARGGGAGNSGPRSRGPAAGVATVIWNLGTPISSVGRSISNVTFDIEDFDIECSFDIDVFYIRFRISISKGFDIEGHSTRYRR